MRAESEFLQRLGPIPYWRGYTNPQPELEKIYELAIKAAAKELREIANESKP